MHMSIKTLGIVTLAVALMAPAVWLEARQSGAARAELRAAIDTEMVAGDLPAAIKQYQAIIQKHGASDRATAATALLRMADCYRKLGDGQARATYERVVREFGDIDDAAGSARAQLAALNASAASRTTPALALRRIYDGPGLDWCNGLSSDVRYLSHPDWDTGNIAVTDLRTGKPRAITKTGSLSPVTAQTGEFGECSVFSPDDREVAFYWSTRKGSELRLARLDGSGLRTVMSAGDSYLQPLDWSRDGRFVLVLISPKDTGQLAIVSVNDGAVRVVKEVGDHSGRMAAAFSPDGRFVAYSVSVSPDSKKADLFVVGADGTGERALVQHPADDYVLGWAPDGRRVFFSSDRTGSYGVWSVEIANGQAGRGPTLVKPDLGPITPIRFVNGTLYYHLSSQLSDIQIASIDPATGRFQPAAPAKPNFSGSNAKPAWSPDGASLAYISFRGTTGYPAAPEAVSILNLASGVERRIRPAIDELEPFGSGPVWSPDGRSLLVIGRQQTPQHGIHRVDVETGATTPVVSVRNGTLLHALWSRDGRSVFYTLGGGCTAGAPCLTRILRRDLATGTDLELAALPNPAGIPRIAVSPDGLWLAFTSRSDELKPVAWVSLVPAAGGEARRIYRAPDNEGTGFVAWSPDGRYVYFTKQGELWRVTPDGKQVEKVQALPGRGAGWFSFSPDGRRVAFTLGESKSELWALENLAAAVNPR
jgi:Tol biopolymer transport system component